MSRIALVISVGIGLFLCGLVKSKPRSDINAKVAQLEIGSATLDDVIRIFGEPAKYIWARETFTKDNLPGIYIAAYPNDIHVVIGAGKVSELRFEGPGAGYLFKDKLKIGSSLEDVLATLGKPKQIVEGKPNEFKENVLYKDINGRKGLCYYHRPGDDVRIFFANYRITALYLTRLSWYSFSPKVRQSRPGSDLSEDERRAVRRRQVLLCVLGSRRAKLGDSVLRRRAGDGLAGSTRPRTSTDARPSFRIGVQNQERQQDH